MSRFNNHEYQLIVSDLIGDAFYTTTSYRGKIATIRQYAEVVVRKILDIDPRSDVSLGADIVGVGLKKLPHSRFVRSAVKKLRTTGNKSTHTKFLKEITEHEFEKATDGLLDLLSYLLIAYFTKYEFGTNNQIMFAFSILPPIIRYKVLLFLHEKVPENISVVEKLVLAMLKAFDIATAKKWIEENKIRLMGMRAYSELEVGQEEIIDPIIATVIRQYAPQNMYQLCNDKIDQIGVIIQRNGPMYSDFESALPYYERFGIIQEETAEAKEFNDIMEFIYMGRKAREQLCADVNCDTIVLDAMDSNN